MPIIRYDARGVISDLLASLEADLAAHPDWPDLRYLAAQAHLSRKDFAAARRELELAIARNPRYVDAHVTLALAEQSAKEPERAAAALEALRAAAGGDARFELGSGLVHARARRFDEARAALERATELAPDRTLPPYALAVVLDAMGASGDRVRAAADTRFPGLGGAAHDPQIVGDPGRAQLFRECALLLASRGEHAAASPHLDLAFCLDLDLAADVAARAEVSFQRGDVLEAIDGFRRAIERDPKIVDARVSLALALGVQGLAGEAIAALEEAVRMNPRYPDLRHHLATMLIGRGEHAAAGRELEAALRENEGYADARFSLGLARAAGGDHAGAADAFEAALRLGRRGADALVELGFARLRLGELGAAEARLLEAVALDDSDPRAHMGLALLFEGRGDRDSARRHLAEVLRMDADSIADPEVAALRERLG